LQESSQDSLGLACFLQPWFSTTDAFKMSLNQTIRILTPEHCEFLSKIPKLTALIISGTTGNEAGVARG
jgi:hypothetical protein